MQTLNATKKLFHAIVVIGMATSLGCSSGTVTGDDAATDSASGDDATTKDASTQDVFAKADAPSDGDAFTGWLGC